jgi:hypothetical protein
MKISSPHQRPAQATISTPDLQQQIRVLAYSLYEQRGREGHELDDWLQAELEVTQQKAKNFIA